MNLIISSTCIASPLLETTQVMVGWEINELLTTHTTKSRDNE